MIDANDISEPTLPHGDDNATNPRPSIVDFERLKRKKERDALTLLGRYVPFSRFREIDNSLAPAFRKMLSGKNCIASLE